MKSTFLWGACAASIFLVGAAQAQDSWKEIKVPLKQYNVRVGNDVKKIKPSCALGEPYSFHFKPGKLDKLLVYYNGGGSCWNSNTCVGSLDPHAKPVYVPSATVDANKPALMGGILDVNNPKNPYADWSMLFISYCTGDVHVGSADTVYANPISPSPLPNPVTIHHRGFDNSVYALNWVKGKIKPDKILVAGSSAGSYGATLNLPWLKAILKSPTLKEYDPDAYKTFAVSDGGMGVITDAHEFVHAVFGESPVEESSVWNIYDTLHPTYTSFPSLPDAVIAQPENLLPVTLKKYIARNSKDKIAQYTTAYDVVQIFFWDIMLHPDTPQFWGAGLSNPLFIRDWNIEMNTISGGLIASLPKNYRRYNGPGCNHTIFRHDDDFYNSSLKSSSVQTIAFLQWLTAMTEEKNANKNNWKNLSCTPGDCGETNLTPVGIQACLARTFAL
jgi:hypothetical protein